MGCKVAGWQNWMSEKSFLFVQEILKNLNTKTLTVCPSAAHCSTKKTRFFDMRGTGISFWVVGMIFDSEESWKLGLFDKKVFYPTQKFCTLLFCIWILKVRFLKWQNFEIFNPQKGGKKLLRGRKTFIIKKYAISSFAWIKNQIDCSKIDG